MKITLYDRDSVQVYTACDVTKWPDYFFTALQFTGTDEMGRKRTITTSLPFTAEKTEPLDLAKEAVRELREGIKGSCGGCK